MQTLTRLIAVMALALSGTTNSLPIVSTSWAFSFQNIQSGPEFPELSTLSGMLFGTLTHDGDTILVEQVTMAEISGDVFSAPFIITNPDGVDPFVTISGLEMGLRAVTTSESGFEVVASAGTGVGSFGTESGCCSGSIDWNPQHWSIATKVQVPVPPILALFSLGLAGLGWSRRKTAYTELLM